jgi:acyl-CoA hydrolase
MEKIHVGSRLCKTMDLSLGQILFAGKLLEWAAECGSIFSMKYTGSDRHMALYRIDGLRITKPIKVGMLMDFYADDIRLGVHSISFRLAGEVRGKCTISMDCTYVQIDENGEKIPLPPKREKE